MKPVFKANIFALIVIIGQVLGGTILVPIFRHMNLSMPTLLVLTQVIFLIIPSIIYFIITKKSIKETLRLNPISFKEILILIVITLLSQFVAGFLVSISNMFSNNVVEEAFRTLESLSLGSMIFIMAVVPAICEEIVMRGIVLSGYDKKSTLKAALMNGLIFGILHLNPNQFLYAFALGVLFAYIVRITNSIFATMLCHFTFNGFQVVLSRVVMNVPGVEEAKKSLGTLSRADMFKELVNLGIVAMIATIIIIFLLKVLSNMRKKRGQIVSSSPYSYSGDGTISIESDFNEKELREEFVINIPFIITVLFYGFYIYRVYF
ncbi:CPBP family intramembrane metalloprotease [Clostridium sp. MSJ-4]|uniref:CPBP family intramembrane metalloprotease n=1 Tax=Clostridium simiarum TaxID=2841506 RepID=A0ABS6F788_9CLOT|nr:type II CAAX endopeptidase family protein [Clostridium simiarum]MBU5593483.1 CPBP family intramembrane metalloprotease [Clostridium simiarum]